MFGNSFGGGAARKPRLTEMLGFGPQAGGAGPVAPAAPSAPAAPVARTATATAPAVPAQDGAAQMGSYGGGGRPMRGFNPEKVQRRMGRLAWENAQRAQGPLWDSIQGMLDYGSSENRAAALAPEMEAIGRFEDRAVGQSLASMVGRGLDESSYGGAVEGTIRSGANEQRAGAVRNRIGTEQAAQAANAAFLSAIQSGNMDAAQRIVESMRQADLMQQQIDAQNSFGWGDLGSLIGGAAGIGFAGGWKPFKPTAD